MRTAIAFVLTSIVGATILGGCGTDPPVSKHPAGSDSDTTPIPDREPTEATKPVQTAPITQPPAQQQLPVTTQLLPEFVQIQILNATIDPVAPDGSGWDGFGVPFELTNEVAGYLDVPEDQANLANTLINNQAMSLIAAPDIAGKMSIKSTGQTFPEFEFDSRDDTFTPSFDTTWKHVKLADGIQITIRLRDVDTFFSDDDLPTLVLDTNDVKRALATPGGAIQLPTSARARQIDFVGVRVIADP